MASKRIKNKKKITAIFTAPFRGGPVPVDFGVTDVGGHGITFGGDIFGTGVEGTIPGTEGIPIDLDFGSAGGSGSSSNPPGDFNKKGLAAGDEKFCLPFFSEDPITGRCVPDFDPGPGQGAPGGNGAAGTGLNRPRAVSRTVLECPTFADGRKGLLWMNALTGDVVCLPRGTSGRGFGLIRKNRPRRKAFISAAEWSRLQKRSGVEAKAKKFAGKAGFTCKRK